MPELPEVETVRRVLKEKVVGHKITGLKVYYAPIIEDFVEVKEKIINQTILDINRIGKYLIFVLEDYVLVSHLRMEGKFYIKPLHSEFDQKHTHVILELDGDKEIQYHDTRKFGRMKLMDKEGYQSLKPFNTLASEPWQLDSKLLYERLQRKSIPIKQALLDQTIILGLGNIYANEVCFDASIHPLKASNRLSKKKVDRIVESSMKILDLAIEMGGTTIRSYTSSLGVDGRFQQKLMVHGLEGEPCQICHTPILKIKVNGRGTYYCPKCQKK